MSNEAPDQRCCPPPPRPNRAWLSDYATLFKALGDPTRLEMIDLLARADGALCVCDIESCFELSQPTISHHLRLLRKAGLVSTERRGTWMHYRLSDGCIERFRTFAGNLVQPPVELPHC
jgi:ArsR family transcriptional regulator